MPIRFLPPALRERIAAGEVIDRPAAVVKELIENAIDAGATQISVDLRAGGYSLIRVTDDGCGIPSDQLALAIARHATSKIGDAAELGSVRTLGFRGEALASIAAVSELTVASRVAGSAIGAGLTVRGGSGAVAGHHAGPAGTVITVRDLFFNLPPRRQTTASGRETSRIGDLAGAYALAHPAVRWRVTSQGSPVLVTHGDGLAATLPTVVGQEIAARLLPIEADGVRGWLSPPGTTRSDRRQFVLVVNGRPVGNIVLFQAVEHAYRALLPRGRHPIGVLRLDLPPADVDSNIHPGKLTVGIVDEPALARALTAAVEQALSQRLVAPAWPRRAVLGVANGQATFGRAFGVAEDAPAYSEAPDLAKLRPMGQIDAAFIVASAPDGLYLVDQHRAHERILFDAMDPAQGSLLDDDGDRAASACRSALKKGQLLDPGEQAELLRRLAATDTPTTCPHGSPILVRFDSGFIRRQFGRR